MKRWMMIGLGVLVGYAAAAILSTAMTTLMKALFEVARSEHPPSAYLVFDLLYGTAFAGLGAWIAAWFARSRIPAYVLAAISFLLIGLGAVAGWDTVHPMAYQWAATILTPLAIVLGGLLVPESRLRENG